MYCRQGLAARVAGSWRRFRLHCHVSEASAVGFERRVETGDGIATPWTDGEEALADGGSAGVASFCEPQPVSLHGLPPGDVGDVHRK